MLHPEDLPLNQVEYLPLTFVSETNEMRAGQLAL